MPLLDWTRTHLDIKNKNGSTALRFSAKHMAAFEIKFLNRKNASEDYHPDAVKNGIYWFNKSTIEEKNNLLMSYTKGSLYLTVQVVAVQAVLNHFVALAFVGSFVRSQTDTQRNYR